MKKRDKEPSLLRQIIAIHYEQCLRRRALRIASRQEWSVDFLSAVVAKAAKSTNIPVEIILEDNHGHKMHIRSLDVDRGRLDDDDIFNHLDDETAVNNFIREHSKR